MLRRTAVLLAAGALLTGCMAPDSDDTVAGSSPTPPQPVAQETSQIDYVALGDSYTAGPLISTVRSDPSGCARSTNNYPAFLAEWLRVQSYRDVSCSGAATADVAEPQSLVFSEETTPPQRRVLSADTDLVTVGLGGNDFDIFARLSNCGRPLAAEGAQPCELDPAALVRDAGRVEDRLVRALRIVQRRAPQAEVVVVGYPRVLPGQGTCPTLGVTKADAAVARRVAAALEESQRGAARRTGAAWVSLTEVSAGHDACAGPDSWITGAEFTPGQPAPLHPRIEGMRGIAAAVLEVVAGEEPPPSAGPSAAPATEAIIRNPVLR